MLKLNYFLADIFILSAEKQPIKLSWRKIEWLRNSKTLSVEYKFVCGFEFLILKLSVTRYHSSTVVVFGFQKE